MNPINNKDKKCFQYAVTVMLNYEKIEKDPQRMTKIKTFINKYNWKEKRFPKHLRKIMELLLLIFCLLNRKTYSVLIFQKQ